METPFISASSSQGVSAGTSIVSLDAASARAKVKPMIFSPADSYEEPASARETTVVPGDLALAYEGVKANRVALPRERGSGAGWNL